MRFQALNHRDLGKIQNSKFKAQENLQVPSASSGKLQPAAVSGACVLPMPFPSAVRCAIFDLDGTLLNSLEDLADSGNAMLRACGYPVHDPLQYRYFVGDGARTLVQRILPESLRDNDSVVQACLDRYIREYAVRWDQKTRPYEGIPALLQELASRNIALAVLSNKPHTSTVQCIQRLCPAPPGSEWKIVLGSRDSIPQKPHPGGVEEILRTLQIAPAETIYFGDTGTDMKTAVAAGVFPIGVLWGFRPGEELEHAGAKLLLACPSEVLAFLSPRPRFAD